LVVLRSGFYGKLASQPHQNSEGKASDSSFSAKVTLLELLQRSYDSENMRTLALIILTCASSWPQTIPFNGGSSPRAERRISFINQVSEFAWSVGPSGASSAGSDFHPKIPDIAVVDQDGRKRLFFTDLVKDKVVAINFIFTRCTTICLPLGATFSKLQRSFGSAMGKDVFLISVSIDPLTDTPERLHEWGKKFGAGPGWTLVTGPPGEIKRLQQSFGLDTAAPEDHSPVVVIGSEKNSRWRKVYGLGSSGLLVKTIQEISL
jgi:cytochrome oxidase Cu insertion factor (SCO1/SenC/PrrC family)